MRCTFILCLALLSAAAVAAAQTNLPWTQLSLSTSQVDAFRKAHPDVDGRGIVIAVLDTGVDMGVPGLQKTPAGEVKVIDVQDFSGQGDVEIARALWNDEGDKIVHYAEDGSPELFVPPPADARPEGTTVWFGLIEEETYTNSAVSDVNDNGKEDDVFGVCVVSRDRGTDDDAVCYVDADGDRDFSDETPLRNYKINYDTFTFARTKKESQIIPLTCAVNIFIGERKIVVHHDDGGHGTHVAGIASGYGIMGQEGFTGVAPGAKVISMKLGENRLSGGATTTGSMQAAFEYAAQFAREHNVTVVCNLSFGIGSIREGHHTIDKFVDDILRKNPNLIICTSAGNEGPGLSSVGTPAGANAAISVAALLAVDTARDVMGLTIPQPMLTTFSSRGGELDKPDVATPGMMTSTVPLWNREGDFWGGTSMASPYAAGLCALLAQQVRDQHGIAPRADWIKAALKNTAEPVPGFNALDYGAGIPNIVKASEAVNAIIAKHRDDPLYAYTISTERPLAVDGASPAAYWRASYFPSDRPQVFTIKPVFVPQTDASALQTFSKRLTLRSNADWCKPQQEQIYFRDVQEAKVSVLYDAAKLTKPGLYVGTIEGLEDGEVVLRLVNTIIVPYRANSENDFRSLIENQMVHGYIPQRYFFDVPAGASAMHVKIRAPEGKSSWASINYLNTPQGLQLARGRLRLDTENDRREASYAVSKDLMPGVWELAVTSSPDKDSAYSLEVRFDGVHAEPQAITNLDAKPGSKPSGDVTFINVFDRPTTITTSGQIEGYRKESKEKATPDEAKKSLSLSFTSAIRAARIRVEVSDKDYAKFTDAAVNVLDASGTAIAQNGMSESSLTMEVANPNPGAESTSCTLEITPAFSEPNLDISAEFDVRIDYLYTSPIDLNVKRGSDSQVTLYPGVPTEFSWSATKKLPATPDGTIQIGYIRATERASQQAVAEIEITKK